MQLSGAMLQAPYPLSSNPGIMVSRDLPAGDVPGCKVFADLNSYGTCSIFRLKFFAHLLI